MDQRNDWLNEKIDQMRAGKSLLTKRQLTSYQPDVEDIAALRMAARFNAASPGAAQPNEEFVERLRARLRTFVVK